MITFSRIQHQHFQYTMMLGTADLAYRIHQLQANTCKLRKV